jgi:hypothetical protein
VDAALALGLTAEKDNAAKEGGTTVQSIESLELLQALQSLQSTDVRLKSFLTDLDDPLRLCKATTDDPAFLEGEPVGELTVDIASAVSD